MSPKDLIEIFVRHRNAANLLMMIMLIGGAVGLARLNTQMLPDLTLEYVLVSVDWPGASAEDVESGIVEAIEPEVRYLEGVRRVIGGALEGYAFVAIQFAPGTDMAAAQSRVESAVDRISTFPDSIDRPVVEHLAQYEPVSRLLLHGPYSEAALKEIAKQIRDELLARGVDQVELVGARDEEIHVEVAPETLRRLDLTLGDIGAAISNASRDMPAGTLGGTAEKAVRSEGLAETAREIADIEVRAFPDGRRVALRDIASVSDTFDEEQIAGWADGGAAVMLSVNRAPQADTLDVARIVEAYVEEKRATLPPTLGLEQFDIRANYIKERISLLVKNGIGGLILVIIVLLLFLEFRLAFWVAMGIPVALTATFAVMLLAGQSINMVSLFAIIMALGIIVDDAIVVGEHTQYRAERGMPPLEAAETGALRMLAPVTASSLTTIAAFLPMFLIRDEIGQITETIPFVVICVLLASLAECFLILPAHLRAALSGQHPLPRAALDALAPAGNALARFRTRFDAWFFAMRDGRFRRLVGDAVQFRWTVIAASLAGLIVCIGILAGGRIGFVFFPSPGNETIYANFEFAPGTPRERVEAMAVEMERALRQTERDLGGERGSLINASWGKIGETQGEQFATKSGDHLGGLHVEIVSADRRDVTVEEILDHWRAEIEQLPGLERITLAPLQVGPPGRELDIRLIGGAPEVLKQAAGEVITLLERFPGVSAVVDNLPYGKEELVLEVTPRGRSLGFDTSELGRQVRDAFSGNIARRFSRGDEEVTVRVQYPDALATESALRQLYLRSPGGAEVALTEVATIREQGSFARILREDGLRNVAVVGEIDETVTTADEVLAGLERAGIAEIARKYGLSWRFAGKAEEQARSFEDVQLGAMIGLALIYIILAWVFASYWRPIVVMLIIPFGLVGAVIGHLVMGFDLTMMSLVALLGLSGILVNDSIILVSTIDERLAAGEAWREAIVKGTCDRLRPVLLTSLTTIGGLLPLMFETSFQAQFLVPMAITIVFGLLFATLLVLLLVPAMIAVQESLGEKRAARRPDASAVQTGS